MSQPVQMTLSSIVLDCPDAHELAAFYQLLLGWTVVGDDFDWVRLQGPDGGTGLSFQSESTYVRPTWPSRISHQQMMMHLDIRVDDLAAAEAGAVAAGAVLADFQPQDDVRVFLDPAGHPFCLFRQGG